MATTPLDSLHPPRSPGPGETHGDCSLWARKAFAGCPRDALSSWGAGDNQKWGHMLSPSSPALLPRRCFPHLLPAFFPPRGALSLPPPPPSVWLSSPSWWHWNQRFRFSTQLPEGSGVLRVCFHLCYLGTVTSATSPGCKEVDPTAMLPNPPWWWTSLEGAR